MAVVEDRGCLQAVWLVSVCKLWSPGWQWGVMIIAFTMLLGSVAVRLLTQQLFHLLLCVQSGYSNFCA